jgi:hypothetical protein
MSDKKNYSLCEVNIQKITLFKVNDTSDEVLKYISNIGITSAKFIVEKITFDGSVIITVNGETICSVEKYLKHFLEKGKGRDKMQG